MHLNPNGIENLINALFPVSACNRVNMPKPVSVVYQKKHVKLVDENGQPKRDKNGKRLFEEKGYVTVVMFDDGLEVQVSQGDKDEFDLEKAVLYAIAKRAYGKIVQHTDKDGRWVTEVEGDGYGRLIHTTVVKAVDRDAARIRDEQKKAAKKAADAKKTTAVSKQPKENEAKVAPKQPKETKKPAKKASKKSAAK